jgi:hypothetical protein
MPQFEVFIPANDQVNKNVTLKVEAANWMDALRTGLVNIGEDQSALSNIMCDVQPDNSMHITDPGTKRVFRLRELGDGANAPLAPSQAKSSGPSPRASGGTAAPTAAKAPPPSRPSGQFTAAPTPTRSDSSHPAASDPKIGRAAVAEANIEDVIAQVFEATQELMESGTPDPKRICEFMLDLALQQVPASAGTFFLADINAHELTFEAVRGPKADAIKNKKITVPVGQGVVGFCAQEGVCLVIEDMQHDSRYFSAISEAIGHAPRNSLCASAEHEGRLLGAIQLIDRKEGSFTAAEMEVVRYIGLAAANMLERTLDV